VPLDLAFARTIHEFQGLSAGPVDPGKIPNMYDCIICDPDKKLSEVRATGLFYTALSRATTFGDSEGLNSAIYFMGENIDEDRIKNVTRAQRTNKEFKNVQLRRSWVAKLDAAAAKTKTMKTDTKRAKDLIHWSMTKRYTYEELYNRIELFVKACQHDNLQY
jgi:hypothetical protein